MNMSIFHMLENISYREALIDSLCGDKTTYDKPIYNGDDNLILLVLPAVARLWKLTYIDSPSLLKGGNLLLYKLMFDIDEFIDEFILILNSNISIEVFRYLDRSSELVKLVIDNYLARKFQIAYNSRSIENDIIKYKRELVINKIIK